MKKLTLIFALGMASAVAFAQNQDCICLGNWVQTADGSPLIDNNGPYFIESHQTEACDPLVIATHGHDRLKVAKVFEIGGSCSTLSWIPQLATLYDSSHVITVPVSAYTIPGGFESREYLTHKTGYRLQAFECQVEGVPQKTLERMQVIQYDHLITVDFIKIRDCPAEPGCPVPAGGPGGGC
ncbi:MAG: hypothetical protein WD716_10825 [Fimbriimonadaceae bacterium]